MKFGGMIQIHELKQELSANQEYQYEGQWLGNRAAEFLIGWPPASGQSRPQAFERQGAISLTSSFRTIGRSRRRLP